MLSKAWSALTRATVASGSAPQLVAILGRRDHDLGVAEQHLAPVAQRVPVLRLEGIRVRPERVDRDDLEPLRGERRRRVRPDEARAARDEDCAHPRASLAAPSTASAQWPTEWQAS